MVKVSDAVGSTGASPTLAINMLAAEMRAQQREIVHLGFGQSPFPAPARLVEALQSNAHRNEYLPILGLAELREAVARYYGRKAGFDSEQFTVVIAPGSKLLIYVLQMAVPGDLIVPVPSWVSYIPQAGLLGSRVISLAARLSDHGYELDAERLEHVIHDARREGLNPTKIILNYPNNPTGLSIPEDCLKAVAAVCEQEDILIISDEIYGFTDYGGTYRSIARYAPSHCAVTTGLSKHLSLGGWRFGVAFLPRQIAGLEEIVSHIASETWSCVPAPIQYAAIEAYHENAEVEKHIRDCTAIHRHLATYLADELRSLGLDCPSPQGAFYVYPDFAVFGKALYRAGILDSAGLAERLLAEESLLALPGSCFSEASDRLTLRLAVCDYDGGATLAALQKGDALDQSFIFNNAPNLVKAVEIFGRFASSLAKQAPVHA